MSRHRTFVRGFTLIELLVVVAIIGLLVSILLPSLKLARDSAKGVVCGSNVRSQLVAATQYADDNLDLFIAGLLDIGPPAYPTLPLPNESQIDFGLGQQYLLPYLNYEIPLNKMSGDPGDPAEVERMRYQNLFGGPAMSAGAYRSNERWQGRMGDAFSSIEVYQCPGMPPVAYSGDVTTSDLDYVMNTMPSPMIDQNILGNGRRPDLRPDNARREPAGVPSGSVLYWGKRPRSSITAASERMYIGEVDEGLIEQDLQSDGGQTDPTTGRARNSFIFHNIFLATHLPGSRLSRMDDDFEGDGETRKRHPGGANVGFFDGHVDMMGYSEVDPGFPNAVSIRLRFFTDISKLSDQWLNP